jgi:plastocyanin
MRPSARHLATLLLCGLCALAGWSAIALAVPGQRAGRRRSVSHASACATAGRTQRARPRHRSRCRAPHHASTSHGSRPAASTPGAAAPGAATGASPTGGAPSPPVPGTSGSQPEASGSATPTAPPSVTHVQVTAVEFHFTLSRATVPAGKVVFEFVNDGQDEHNLNMLTGDGRAAGSFADARAGAISSQTVEMRPGTYTLFCSLPEHEQKGMKATLVVE